MHRLLLLLFFFAFAVSNSVAAPLALCHHGNAEGHGAALASNDLAVAAAAHVEDSAEAASKSGAISDVAAAAMGVVVLPAGAEMPLPLRTDASRHFAHASASLLSRAIPPLLQPPLA